MILICYKNRLCYSQKYLIKYIFIFDYSLCLYTMYLYKFMIKCSLSKYLLDRNNILISIIIDVFFLA